MSLKIGNVIRVHKYLTVNFSGGGGDLNIATRVQSNNKKYWIKHTQKNAIITEQSKHFDWAHV